MCLSVCLWDAKNRQWCVSNRFQPQPIDLVAFIWNIFLEGMFYNAFTASSFAGVGYKNVSKEMANYHSIIFSRWLLPIKRENNILDLNYNTEANKSSPRSSQSPSPAAEHSGGHPRAHRRGCSHRSCDGREDQRPCRAAQPFPAKMNGNRDAEPPTGNHATTHRQIPSQTACRQGVGQSRKWLEQSHLI